MRPFPVLAVLAGGDLPPGYLPRLAALCERIVAADSAADRLLAEGIRPDLTLGDFDSRTAPDGQLGEVLHLPDQESTDADKTFRTLVERGESRILVTGTEGDLPDHHLASLQSMAKSEAEIWIAFRRGFGRILRGPDRATLAADLDGRVSIVPLSVVTGVTTEGLAWPLENDSLDPLGRSGISNRATADWVSIRVLTGAALVFVETRGEPFPALAASFRTS